MNLVAPSPLQRVVMTLRSPDEDDEMLTELAQAEGVSKQEATVRAIREAATRRGHESQVRELSAKSRERYASVLQRLGE